MSHGCGNETDTHHHAHHTTQVETGRFQASIVCLPQEHQRARAAMRKVQAQPCSVQAEHSERHIRKGVFQSGAQTRKCILQSAILTKSVMWTGDSHRAGMWQAIAKNHTMEFPSRPMAARLRPLSGIRGSISSPPSLHANIQSHHWCFSIPS